MTQLYPLNPHATVKRPGGRPSHSSDPASCSFPLLASGSNHGQLKITGHLASDVTASLFFSSPGTELWLVTNHITFVARNRHFQES